MGLMTREEGVTKRKSSSHLHSVQLRLWQVPLSSSKIPRAYTRTIFKKEKLLGILYRTGNCLRVLRLEERDLIDYKSSSKNTRKATP